MALLAYLFHRKISKLHYSYNITDSKVKELMNRDRKYMLETDRMKFVKKILLEIKLDSKFDGNIESSKEATKMATTYRFTEKMMKIMHNVYLWLLTVN